MNFVGHIATGLAVDPDTTFLLGTALPDFAAMARLRLERTRAQPGLPGLPAQPAQLGQLGRGIQLHHQTDAVFHHERWFLDFEHELQRELIAAGVPRGGALACAHVGVELLLDGELLNDPTTAVAVADVYAVMNRPPAAALAVAPENDRVRWSEHLRLIAIRLDPALYADPVVVAERLHRITAARPRLAFGTEHIPTIVARLARMQPRIADSASAMIATVRDALVAGIPDH